MITWGAVGNSHDASLAVFDDTNLLWAGLAKDFSGIPHDPNLNDDIIKYALENWGQPENIVWYERPVLKTLRQFWAGQGWLLKENNIEKYFKDRGITCPKIVYTQHHHSHAAYAYYTQPHDDCAVICLDSIGEFEALTVWHGKNGNLKKIYSQSYPHSPGLFYSAMTQRIGLVPQRDEYMIADMGKDHDPMRFMRQVKADFIKSMPSTVQPDWKFKENLHRGCRWWQPEIQDEESLRCLAATTQKIFEDAVAGLSAWARYYTSSRHVALSGGGALNRQALKKIEHQWLDVHVPKNPGDPGSCIGSVLAHTKTITNLKGKWYGSN
jgi:carbamoyltransferase